MSHPRIAEVDEEEDSSDLDMVGDPDEMDLDAFDFARPQKGTLGSASDSTPQPSQPSSQQRSPPISSLQDASHLSEQARAAQSAEHRERSKNYQCLYPCYFDAARSRARGRRVAKEQAVANPLARGLVDALQTIGNDLSVPLQIVFEPAKQHPDDWANPGRVRVEVKREGKAVNRKIQNKHHLYTLIAAYLKAHPTTADAPMKLKLQGMPPMEQPPPPPAVPRGFRMNSILPLHSPALSGGGVSENMFKDMMAEMEGMGGAGGLGGLNPAALMGAGGGGGGGGGGAAGGKKVKEKKKK